MNAQASGSCHFAKSLARNSPSPSRAPEELAGLIPADENQAFDVKELIDGVVDGGSFFEIHPRWARALVVRHAPTDGPVLGVVASQPRHRGAGLLAPSAHTPATAA